MMISNFFTRIFKNRNPSGRTEYIPGNTPMFAPFSGRAYENDIYRAAVDAIARNAAKLKGTHVIKTDSGRDGGNSYLDRLLQVRPNPYINAFDMLYRMVTHYFLYNNAFAYLQKDNSGKLISIYPIKPSSVEFIADPGGNMFCKFLLNDGNSYILPYADIIHLRRHYNDNDMFGDSNTALIPALELSHTMNEGIISAIKNTAHIRGILRITHPLGADALKQERVRFITDYMQMDNNGGVIVTDSKGDYEQLKPEPYPIDDKHLQTAKTKIYGYLGVNEKIVDSTYNEEEWAAFYESVLEPIAVQLSLEFTDKIFSTREQAFGNSILFEANRLQYSSVETKAKLIKEIMPMGLLSVNQALEILNMPGIPDGGKRIVSLNYVNADKADKYQLGSEEQ